MEQQLKDERNGRGRLATALLILTATLTTGLTALGLTALGPVSNVARDTDRRLEQPANDLIAELANELRSVTEQPACGGGDVVTVSRNSFKSRVLEHDVPVLVDFWAPWCPPCLRLSETLRTVAEKMNGRVVIARVNVAQQPALAKSNEVGWLPTMVLFHEGEEHWRATGSRTEATMIRTLERLLEETSGHDTMAALAAPAQ